MDNKKNINRMNSEKPTGNPIKKEAPAANNQKPIKPDGHKQPLTIEQRKSLIAKQLQSKNLTPEQRKSLIAKHQALVKQQAQAKTGVKQVSPEERKRLAKEEFLRKKKTERESRIKANRGDGTDHRANEIVWTEDRIQQIIQEVMKDNVLMDIAEVKTAIEFMTNNVSKLASLHKFKKQKRDQLDKLGFTMR